MNSHTMGLRLSFKLMAIAALIISMIVPAFMAAHTGAAQVTSRFVRVSSSAPSATAVVYEVGFTPTATSFQSLIVDFCSDSPIVGATCTATAGTNVPQFTGAASPGTGGTGTVGTWTASTLSGGQIRLNGAANASATAQLFRITGVTNPSATASFYARIYTFSNATYGTYTAAATPGNYIDSGGMALATSTVISISARVQETLTFCVSKGNPTTGCGGLTAPDLTLGTGSPKVLTTAAASGQEDFAYFQVTTNASGNVIVRMKGERLQSGANFIPTTATGNNTPFVITAGTANFGMRIGTTSGTDYSATGITIDSNYLHASSYGWDVTTATNNVVSGYGDPIATVTASVDSWARMFFGATVSASTPAGLYTTTENLIATGTY